MIMSFFDLFVVGYVMGIDFRLIRFYFNFLKKKNENGCLWRWGVG